MLAHNLIRKDIEIIDVLNNRIYSSETIRQYTNYLKHCIYNRLNGETVNKIIFVDTNDFFIVVCCLQATWELGASIFLNDVDPKIKFLPYFKKFYNVIDLVVGPSRDSFWIAPEKRLATDNFLSFKEHELPEFDKSVEISPDTVAFYNTSSGTTGDPKLLKFSHYQTVTICQEIKNYLGLTDQVKPFHFKTLHHGSLFASFCLPMLSTCQTHYCGNLSDEKFLNKIIDVIEKYQVDYFLLPYNWLKDFVKVPSKDLKNQVTFITIAGNTTEEMQDLFARFRPKQVLNYFGCSEIGTMFISRTTIENLSEYNPNRFYDVMPYLDYEILENSVKCKWKHLDEWFVIADKMQKQEQSIWHFGREIVFSIEDHKIVLQELNQLITQEIGTPRFLVVPDYIQKKLYLALFNKNLSQQELFDLNNKIQQQFSPVFFISDVHCFDPSELLFGMKISGPLLLYLFRERESQK
jgi:hypothetical protein